MRASSRAQAIVRFYAHAGIERKRSDSAVSVQANAGFIGVKRSGHARKRLALERRVLGEGLRVRSQSSDDLDGCSRAGDRFSCQLGVQSRKASTVHMSQRQQVAVRDSRVAGKQFQGKEGIVGDTDAVWPERVTRQTSYRQQQVNDGAWGSRRVGVLRMADDSAVSGHVAKLFRPTRENQAWA